MDVLGKYLQHLVLEHPLVRIIGVGFGHQLIARAFGAQIARDKDHAEVCFYATHIASLASPSSNSPLTAQKSCHPSIKRQNGYVTSTDK